jgi:protein-tyrosine kinase
VTKIYEALEYIQRSNKGPQQERKPPVSPSPVSSSPHQLQSEIEGEMVRLYQNLHTSLSDLTKKVVLFVGSRQGEGTSTIVREFAKVVASRFDRSVVLLDANPHHTMQNLSSSVKPEFGWVDVMLNGKPLDTALYRIGGTNLFVSPMCVNSNVPPQIPNALAWEAFLGKLRERFDLVLIDSPPATLYPDGLSIVNKVDGVVLVVAAEDTRWPVAESVKDHITRSGGRLLGMVFNKRRFYIPEFIYKRL